MHRIKPKKSTSFFLFAVIMLAVAELIIILVLVLETSKLDELIEDNKITTVIKNLITFEMLPKKISQLYKLKQPKTILEDQLLDSATNKEDIQELEKIPTQYIGNDKIVFIKEISCIKMQFGSFEVTDECYAKVNSFLKELNKDMVFEIVPLVQNSDLLDIGRAVAMLNSEDYKKYHINQSVLDNFNRLTRDGLAQNRAQQGMLQIRSYFGNDVKIRLNAFHEFSAKQSGFKIRVYNVL